MNNLNTYRSIIHRASRTGMLKFTLILFFFFISMVIYSVLFAQLKLIHEEDFFYSNGQKVPVLISKNSIGLLAKDGISAKQIRSFSDSLELSVSRELPGGIYVLALKDTLSRIALVDTAREIRRIGEQLIAQTGLVISNIRAETPMIGSDEFVAQFLTNVNKEQIEALNRSNAVEILMENPFVVNQFLLRVTADSKIDVLKMANRYHENELTKFAHPNFVPVIDERQFIPNDPLFGDQWHHRNTGQSGGTVDADIDTDLAWDITLGNAGIVIAVIDGGFDITHPDLTPNFWQNPGEIAGNGVDDDGNTFIDDINGWDFTGCTSTSGPGCGDNDPTGGNHGTSVAGAAAARGNNNLGVSGSCPNCALMLIRRGTSNFAHGLSFGYAQQMGAQIITNSWGYSIGTPATTNVVNAINAAAAAGCIIFFAMNNPNVNDCIGTTPDISSLANVIAVSRSTNQDRFDLSGFGNCMDLLAPSAGTSTISSGRGTLWATTTDVQGTAGYNNSSTSFTCPSTEPAPPPANARDYTHCFNGTSFSTPLTAGVAGLILSVNPGLTRVQVQRLLQDTSDKIEDSSGDYDPNTGFSSPTSGNATHGWGRVNAFEAVRIAATVANDGKDGVDIFLRDNHLDWGNTEQPSNTLFEPTRGFIGHWRSMDIKVDAPPYQPVPTALTFDTFVDETPSAVTGEINRVYVRVRNRGPITANSVTVKLHWTQFGTALPSLPTDFWTAFPNNSINTTQWHPLNCSGSTSSICTITNLTYSGSSIANTAADMAQIVQFDFPAPVMDPALSNHFCLLAMIDSPQDQILPKTRPTVPSDFVVDQLTPTDNNVTHRNYHNLPTSRTDRFEEGFYVRNPTLQSIEAMLRLQAPQGWRIVLDQVKFDEPFHLTPNQELLVTMRVYMPEPNLCGEVTIIQEQADVQPTKVMGGITYKFFGEKEQPIFAPSDGLLSAYLTGTFDLRSEGSTLFHIINPTAKYLRVIVAFFDNNERPLNCVCDSLSPNDLLEIDVKKYIQEQNHGIVKIVSLNHQKNEPEIGIVGYQRHIYTKKCLFFFKKRIGITETVLHSVPIEILQDDLKYIWPICKSCIRDN
jgi:subtilisin family serine protease